MQQQILIVGDIHIKPNNLAYIDELLEKLLALIQERNIKTVVLLGDILHDFNRIETATLNKALDFFTRITSALEDQLYIIVGNHDYINNTQFLSREHWMNSFKHFKKIVIVDTVLRDTQHSFLFVPYVPPGRFIEALDQVEEDWSWREQRVIFAHQELYGCALVRDGSITSSAGDKWLPSYPLCISGHIHLNQRLATNLYYPGAALETNFGEAHYKFIVALLDVDSLEVEEVDLGLSRRVLLRYTIEQLKEIALVESIASRVTPLSLVKLIVQCSAEEFNSFKKTTNYKKLSNSNVKVVHFTLKSEEQNEVSDMLGISEYNTVESSFSVDDDVLEESNFIDILSHKAQEYGLENIFKEIIIMGESSSA